MSINRKRLRFEDEPFTRIPNSWIRDVTISRKARGLLCELLSHKVGWVVTIESLVDAGTEGRDAVRAAIKELVDAGYLVRDRNRDHAGQFRDTAYDLTDPHESDLPTSEKPTLVQPTLDEQPTKKNKSLEEEQETKKTMGERATRTTATALPASFAVDEDLMAWARVNVPWMDLGMNTEAFKNYHQAKGSKFKDWRAAWRNWMLNEKKFAAQRTAPAGPAPGQGVWSAPTIAPDDPRWG